MSHPIEIRNQYDDKVGEITFDDDPINLNVRRIAAGVKLTLPAKLSLVLGVKSDPMPLVSNLHAQLFASDRSGAAMEIGQLASESWYSVGWAEKPGRSVPHDLNMTWRASLTEIAAFEQMRDGRKPELQIQLRGELSYLLHSEHPRYQLRTPPQLIHGDVVLSYPKETWVRELQKVGVLENILVEVPLPESPPAPWDGVWHHLTKAREAFEQGGSP